jgi:hypothetical protein
VVRLPQTSRDEHVPAAPRRVRVLFGMTSATEQPETIEQLIDTLGGRTVVLHHDFTKQPGLRIDRPNVHFVPEPHVTGWGSWTLCLAVLSTMRYALEHFEFDYFQLLSPSCLPLRPIDAFEASLIDRAFDGSMDLMDIGSNEDFLMNYGWRMYAPRGSVRQWILRRARTAYFGRDAEHVQPFGLSVLSDRRATRGIGAHLYKRSAVAIVRALSHPVISGSPFFGGFHAFVGSLWFGASRALCEELLRGGEDPRIVGYFSRLHIPDELLFATLAGNSGRRIEPAHHLINTFNRRGSPRTFRLSDLSRLLAHDAWFARKFPGNPDASVRRDLIARRHPVTRPAGSGTAIPVLPRAPTVVFATCVRPEELPSVERLAARLQGRRLVVHLLGGASTPASRPRASNIDYASTPLTGGFRPNRLNAGVLQLMRYVVECVDFDYLQLLPPDAQPLQPIEAFERFVENSAAEIHAGIVSLHDERVFARHLTRVCASPRSRLAGVLRWAEANLETVRPIRRRVAFLLAAVAANLLPMRHRALRGLSLSVGSLAFGATRDGCQHLVRNATDRFWVEYATAIDDDGSVLFGTLLGDGTFVVGEPNVATLSDTPKAGAPLAAAGPWFVASEAHQPCGSPSNSRGAPQGLAVAGASSLTR